MSSYAFIVLIIILIYAFTFIRLRRNKKDTKNIDSVRDFHKRYSAYDSMHRMNYSDTDNDIRDAVHRSGSELPKGNAHKRPDGKIKNDFTYHYLDKN